MISLLSAIMQIYPVQVLNPAGFSLDNLAWITAGLALTSFIISLAALRRSRRPQTAAQDTAAVLPQAANVSPASDPALIAVLTAAVAMMLAESQTAAAVPSAGPAARPSAAGFTIRKVRRV